MAQRKTYNTQNDWDSLYTRGYNEAFMVNVMRGAGTYPLYYNRVTKLLERFAIQPSDRILVLGAGLGGLVFSFQEQGYNNVWGVDNSTYLEVHPDSKPRMIWQDFNAGGQFKATLRKSTAQGGADGDTFKWIITECVAESYDDADITTQWPLVSDLLEPAAPLSNIIHMVVPLFPGASLDPALNWKLLADWKALLPNHSWVDVSSWEVL